MMENILWSQGLNETDKGFMIIDGVLSRYAQTIEQNQALAILHSDSYKTIADNRKCPKTSPSFKLKRMKEWTCIEGNFIERDDFNRLRVYTFACKSHSSKKVISSLLFNSKLLDCTPMQEDIDAVKNNFKKSQIITSLLCVTIILTIVAVAGICQQ